MRGRADAGYRTRPQFAEALGISERTIGNLERGKSVSDNTLVAVERLLGWKAGSVDDILDRHGEPTMANAVEPDPASPPSAADASPSFDKALEDYQAALRQLRLTALADPQVPPEVADIVESWNTILQALLFGGVAGARKAVRVVAQSYERGQLGDQGETRSA